MRAAFSHPLPGCAQRNCANCPRYALLWRERLLRRIDRPGLLAA
jgi:hypothetical protein